MAELKTTATSIAPVGLHSEPLSGRTMQSFFSAGEEENYVYPFRYDVDFNKRAEFDAAKLSSTQINLEIRELMQRVTVRSWSGIRWPNIRSASASSTGFA